MALQLPPLPRSQSQSQSQSQSRRVYCNRTLNLRSIRAVGFDMDYTLIHYDVAHWERRAYEHAREKLAERGWPVDSLAFDSDIAALGLVLDLDHGNLVKADRFGYVKQASHGTQRLEFEAQRARYSRTLVDLAESRWVFVNTLFGLSESCLFAQLVDALDAGAIPEPLGYPDLYRAVRDSIDAAHTEGALKREIVANPKLYVELDEELPAVLLDLKESGKRLLLITNSDWGYTRQMMSFAFDPFLPKGLSWRSLFDHVIVEARKPQFFTDKNRLFEIADEERNFLRPGSGPLHVGRAYVGGNAAEVERLLELQGEQILYLGDHIFADVHVSKNVVRWRTGLVLRALEQEIDAIAGFETQQASLIAMMVDKEQLEREHASHRLMAQRAEAGHDVKMALSAIKTAISELREKVEALDARIAPLAEQASQLGSKRWGLLLRAGNDKSHLARQIERYADVYTSRVSNLGAHTPFAYLRAPRSGLPHDP